MQGGLQCVVIVALFADSHSELCSHVRGERSKTCGAP
jgi:hypothetical protein